MQNENISVVREGILQYQLMTSDGRLCIIIFFIWVKLLLEVEIPCRFLEELIYKYDKPSHKRRAAAVLTVN